mgnify:CR=1 FL=1
MPSYAVSGASLTGNVAAITLTSVGGLETGYTIEVAGVGSPFDGTYSLASVTSSTGIITYARTAPDVSPLTVGGVVTVPVTWIDTDDVITYLGLGPAEQVDANWLQVATDAANDWAYDRRQAAGYLDVPNAVPSPRCKVGTILYAASIYRSRGSIDGYNSYQSMEPVSQVGTSLEVFRLLGLNRAQVA